MVVKFDAGPSGTLKGIPRMKLLFRVMIAAAAIVGPFHLASSVDAAPPAGEVCHEDVVEVRYGKFTSGDEGATWQRHSTTLDWNVPAPSPGQFGDGTLYEYRIVDTRTVQVEVDCPPVTDPPVTDPPATDPPVTDPPVTDPPVTDPPVTDPPVTDPPVTDPPVTDPPVTDPPVVTEPPAPEPPVTAPPATEPPTTAPPATEPPLVTPPTEPPTTLIPPAVDEPPTPASPAPVADIPIDRELPATGRASNLILALGACFVVAGVTLLVWRRFGY